MGDVMRQSNGKIMRCRWVAVGVGLLTSASAIESSQAPAPLNDAEVVAAIAAGQGRLSKELFVQCSARAGSSLSYENRRRALQVTLFGPRGRIATLASEAKRRYETFVTASVDPGMRERALFVEVAPQDDVDMRYLPPPIEKVVLKSKSGGDSATVVQPADLTLDQVSFGNLLGAKTERNRGLARFDGASVASMPAGDILVAVVTPAGEHTCTVNRGAVMSLLR